MKKTKIEKAKEEVVKLEKEAEEEIVKKEAEKEVKEKVEIPEIPEKEYYENKEIISKRMVVINGNKKEELSLAGGITTIR